MKILRNLVIILSAGFVTNACQDQLDIANPNELSSALYYSNQEEAVAAVDAMYNALIIDGFYQRMTPCVNDGRGDEVRSRSPWPWLSGLSNFTVPPTDGAGEICWLAYYILVNRSNQVLEFVPEIPDVEPQLRERLLGQGYFMRAVANWHLTLMYDNPPLILSVPGGEDEFYPSNEDVTQADFFTQIESDLLDAIDRLPLSYNDVTGPDNGQVGRVTEGAARSLLGKVYLYQGRYEDARDQFAEVVNSNQYALAPDYFSNFSLDPAVENANPEKIFWVEFTTSGSPDFNWGGNPSSTWRQFNALGPTYSARDFYDFFPTQFLINELREERTIDGELDPRYSATLLSYEPAEGLTTGYGGQWYGPGPNFATDPSDTVPILDPNGVYIKKYTGAYDYIPRGFDIFTFGMDYHIIRYADVLLMYAEALANAGDIPTAAQYVQQVRDRVNLPDRQAEFAGMSLNQFMDQIEHERVCELAIEGQRFHDLVRWGKLDNELAEIQANDPEFSSFVPARRFMPIPQSEIDRNPNLAGNLLN